MRREDLWRWGPIPLWVAAISVLSTGGFSAAQTGQYIQPLLQWLLPNAGPATLDNIHFAIRKLAHVTEFGVLALLWYRALAWGRAGWQPRLALRALLVCVGLAALDEAHQAFVPTRTASLADVGWDSLGACLGLIARRPIGQQGVSANPDRPPAFLHRPIPDQD